MLGCAVGFKVQIALVAEPAQSRSSVIVVCAERSSFQGERVDPTVGKLCSCRWCKGTLELASAEVSVHVDMQAAATLRQLGRSSSIKTRKWRYTGHEALQNIYSQPISNSQLAKALVKDNWCSYISVQHATIAGKLTRTAKLLLPAVA